MDINRIRQILPHRYPFLLVDRVVELDPGRRILAYKNVTMNEKFFEGHFPDHPVMPGVLVIEAIAQAGALLAHETEGFGCEGKVIYLMGLDEVRFRQPVRPGDKLDIEVELLRHKGKIWKERGLASVDGQKVAECILLATVIDREA